MYIVKILLVTRDPLKKKISLLYFAFRIVTDIEEKLFSFYIYGLYKERFSFRMIYAWEDGC